jgi:hypothetical protein
MLVNSICKGKINFPIKIVNLNFLPVLFLIDQQNSQKEWWQMNKWPKEVAMKVTENHLFVSSSLLPSESVFKWNQIKESLFEYASKNHHHTPHNTINNFKATTITQTQYPFPASKSNESKGNYQSIFYSFFFSWYKK